jgi:hypothetical protein
MGLEISATDVAALEQRTEGWIAGLQLAALSLQGREMWLILWRRFRETIATSWTTCWKKSYSGNRDRCPSLFAANRHFGALERQ